MTWKVSSAVSYNKLKVTVCLDSTSSTNDQRKFESASYDPIKMRFPLNNYAHQLKVYSNFILKIILNLMKLTSYHGLYQASRLVFLSTITPRARFMGGGGGLSIGGALLNSGLSTTVNNKSPRTQICRCSCVAKGCGFDSQGTQILIKNV